MSILKIFICFVSYILSLLFLWFIPLTPVVSFMETRAQYERDYSLQEIEDIFLKSNNPSIVIDRDKIRLRFLLLWAVSGTLLMGINSIEKLKNKKDEKLNKPNQSSVDKGGAS